MNESFPASFERLLPSFAVVLLSVLVSLGVTALLATPAAAEIEGACIPDADTLCLQANRFSVEVEWDDSVSTGTGQVMAFGTDEAGFLRYQDPLYLDLMIKVLDACTFNDRFWVFSTGLSDAEQTITVTDTMLGNVQTYDNAPGEFPTFSDTNAFPCNPSFAGPVETPSTTEGSTEGPPPTTTLSFGEGRFQVEVDWEDFEGSTGDGIPEQITDASGVFTFFGPANYELIVKIFDGASSNGFYWLFYGATTNVEYNIVVTDLCTGDVLAGNHPLGTPGETIFDDMAFTGIENCILFNDGFESGDTSLWSTTVPP